MYFYFFNLFLIYFFLNLFVSVFLQEYYYCKLQYVILNFYHINPNANFSPKIRLNKILNHILNLSLFDEIGQIPP
jgi:hypothetical protein